LRIDGRHQGRGIGSAALAEPARRVERHWPEASRLVLRVDEGNGAGIRAYEKAG
jgi:RimJ/RimL family protein N-acetyltransferase